MNSYPHVRLIFCHLFAVVFCSACLVPATSQSPDSLYLRRQIDQLLLYDAPVDMNLTPGFIVGIYDGGATQTFSYGSRSHGDNTYLSPRDVFEIGSVTKLFTAAILAELASEGSISLDAGISRGGELFRATFFDLLTHHSGLPRTPNMSGTDTKVVSRYDLSCEDLVKLLAEDPAPNPGTFLYSHIGYALLGMEIGYLTGTYFQETLEGFLGSIGIREAGEILSQRPVMGHNTAGLQTEPTIFNCFYSSEGTRMHMAGLLKFCDYAINEAPSMTWDTERAPAFNRHTAIALGWNVYFPNKRTKVHMHAGMTDGYYAFIGIVRNTRTAVVVLANSAAGTGGLGLELLRTLNNNWRRKT